MIRNINSVLHDNKKLKFASVCFVDPLGQLRSKLVNINKIKSSIEKDGSGFTIALPSLALGYCDTQIEIPGFSSSKDSFGDVPAKIDLGSFRVSSWEDESQNLMCFLELESDYSNFCCRSILKKILKLSKNKKMFPRFGVELEFTLLDEGLNSVSEKNYNNLQTSTKESSYNLLHRQTAQNELYNDFVTNSEKMNIEIEAWHEEMGPGFMEVALSSGKSIKSADDTILIKHLIKQTALRHGKLATFMARWSNSSDGQSGHIHISMENDKKENIFVKDFKNLDLFIKGLQKFAPELMLLFAPNANSYKRYQPEIFTPMKNNWGWDNRKVAFRAIKGKNSRVENRIPGADANPYLSIAATIISGLEGYNNKSLTKNPTIVSLPKNITESFKKLSNSSLAKKYFSTEFIKFFSEFRYKEHLVENIQVTDIEKKRLIEFS